MNMDMGSSSMDMGSSTMDMGSMTMTGSMVMSSMGSAMNSMSDMVMSATATAADASASATSTAMAGMSGMDMGSSSSSSNACKISMLWNWYTIDSCFLAKSWHVTSRSMFGGTCVGVVCLVVCLEALRRLHREFDRYLIREWKKKMANVSITPAVQETGPGNNVSSGAVEATGNESESSSSPNLKFTSTPTKSMFYVNQGSPFRFFVPEATDPGSNGIIRYSPPLLAQLIRAIIYMFEMAGAYFIMLLAMYYNGYILICIFLGALIGNFLFGADTVTCEIGGTSEAAVGASLDKGMCCC